MSLWGSAASRHDYGQIYLSTPLAKELVVADQYYKIPGAFTVADFGRFECSTAGVLTFKGDGGIFLLNGVSDVQVDKACKTTYGLYINGSLVSGAETPHDFAATSKIANISITALLENLANGDEMEVYAKSDTANTLLTPATLIVTFFGARQ